MFRATLSTKPYKCSSMQRGKSILPTVTYVSVALQYRMSLHHRVVGQAHRILCFVTVYLSITPRMSLALITVQIVGIFSGVIRLHCFTAQRVNRLHVYKSTPMACLWWYPAAFFGFLRLRYISCFRSYDRYAN